MNGRGPAKVPLRSSWSRITPYALAQKTLNALAELLVCSKVAHRLFRRAGHLSGQHVQKVTQAVEVGHDLRGDDVPRSTGPDQVTLGSPGDRSREIHRGAGSRDARHDEHGSKWQPADHPVDRPFEIVRHRRHDK